MKRNELFSLDIYSTPTIDIVGSRCKKGGPAYYASLALYMIGARYRINLATIDKKGEDIQEYLNPLSREPVYIDKYTLIFKIDEANHQRRLFILNKLAEKTPLLAGGDFALISPVDAELYSHDVSKIVHSHLLSLIDIQGFTRIRLSWGEVLHSPIHIIEVLNTLAYMDNVIVKLSIEDVNQDTLLLDTIIETCSRKRTPLVITLGYKGSILVEKNYCLLVSPKKLSNNSIGAGDMLSALTLYSIYRGCSLEDSLAKATAATACILSRLEEESISFGACRKSYELWPQGASVKRHSCNKRCLNYFFILS